MHRSRFGVLGPLRQSRLTEPKARPVGYSGGVKANHLSPLLLVWAGCTAELALPQGVGPEDLGVQLDAGAGDGGPGLDAAPFDSGATPDAGATNDASEVGPDAAPRAWEPNDVSILWPAPAAGPLPAGYLRLIPFGNDPILPLPPEALAIIPDLHGDVPGGGLATAAIIALRLDPCAQDPSGRCELELRLTAETLDPSLDDAAIHLIYRLDSSAFEALQVDLQLFRAASPAPTAGPLGPHPGLVAAGVDSDYGRSLHALIERHARPERLVRLTFNTFAFDNWAFRRFDRIGAAYQEVPLPGLTPPVLSQAWLRQAAQDDRDDPSGLIDPLPSRNFQALLRVDALAGGTTTATVLAARDVILALEDPTRSHAAITDCVSCHLAGVTREWAQARGVDFDRPERYRAPVGFEVAGVRPTPITSNLSNTIAFGYHRGQGEALHPVVSDRVAHETSEVLQALAR